MLTLVSDQAQIISTIHIKDLSPQKKKLLRKFYMKRLVEHQYMCIVLLPIASCYMLRILLQCNASRLVFSYYLFRS